MRATHSLFVRMPWRKIKDNPDIIDPCQGVQVNPIDGIDQNVTQFREINGNRSQKGKTGIGPLILDHNVMNIRCAEPGIAPSTSHSPPNSHAPVPHRTLLTTGSLRPD